MRRYPLLCLLLACVSLHCGYTTRSALISQYQTVHVQPFKNNIDFTSANRRSFYFPLLETDIRNAVMDRFLFDGNLRVAAADKADLVLDGKLVDYTRGALRYNDDDDVEEYRVQIFADAVLRESRGEKILWRKRIVGEATYFVSGTLATSESSAVNSAVQDLARRMVEQTIEYW